MRLNKWLKRKFPNHHHLISALYDDATILNYLKFKEYSLAILTNDISDHQKGKLFLVKKSRHMIENIEDVPYWDGTYDIYGLLTCKKNFTTSGYHHTNVREEDYIIMIVH